MVGSSLAPFPWNGGGMMQMQPFENFAQPQQFVQTSPVQQSSRGPPMTFQPGRS
jgi:hypothetical protein